MVPDVLQRGWDWAYGEGGRRPCHDVQQEDVTMLSARNLKILRLVAGLLAITSAVINFTQGNRTVAIVFIGVGAIFLAQVASSSSDGGGRRPPSGS